MSNIKILVLMQVECLNEEAWPPGFTSGQYLLALGDRLPFPASMASSPLHPQWSAHYSNLVFSVIIIFSCPLLPNRIRQMSLRHAHWLRRRVVIKKRGAGAEDGRWEGSEVAFWQGLPRGAATLFFHFPPPHNIVNSTRPSFPKWQCKGSCFDARDVTLGKKGFERDSLLDPDTQCFGSHLQSASLLQLFSTHTQTQHGDKGLHRNHVAEVPSLPRVLFSVSFSLSLRYIDYSCMQYCPTYALLRLTGT